MLDVVDDVVAVRAVVAVVVAVVDVVGGAVVDVFPEELLPQPCKVGAIRQ